MSGTASWIIEKDIFECQPALIKSLESAQIPYDLVNPIELVKKYFYYSLDKKPYGPCLFYGGIRNSITFHQPFFHDTTICPPTFEDFNWSNYGWALGRNALNKYHCLVTAGHLLNNYYQVLSMVSANEKGLFIKPNSSKKPFIAQVITTEEQLKFTLGGINPNTIIMVSAAQEIISEDRFIVGNGKIITGGQYMDGANISFSPKYNQDCFALAEQVAKDMPDGVIQDPFYIMDVAITKDGTPRVVELNGMFTSDWYFANCNDIVRAVMENINE